MSDDDAHNDTSPPADRARRSVGSAWFLGFFAVLFCGLLWLRGLGRLMIPALLIGGVLYGLNRFIRLVRQPVD